MASRFGSACILCKKEPKQFFFFSWQETRWPKRLFATSATPRRAAAPHGPEKQHSLVVWSWVGKSKRKAGGSNHCFWFWSRAEWFETGVKAGAEQLACGPSMSGKGWRVRQLVMMHPQLRILTGAGARHCRRRGNPARFSFLFFSTERDWWYVALAFEVWAPKEAFEHLNTRTEYYVVSPYSLCFRSTVVN